MDEKFAAAEDEGNANGPLPDVPDQAVQEVMIRMMLLQLQLHSQDLPPKRPIQIVIKHCDSIYLLFQN